MFAGYIYYQWRLSEGDKDEVAEFKHAQAVISNIEAGHVTLRGALYYELLDAEAKLAAAPPPEQAAGLRLSRRPSAAEGTVDKWACLPAPAQARFKAICK